MLAIVVLGIGFRFAYIARAGSGFAREPRVGEIAHNIVANGRWFERNARAEEFVEKRINHYDRQIDPASIDYKGLDASGQWYAEVSQSVGASAVLAGLWAITGDERYIQLQLLQGVVDGLTVLLVYWIALQLFKRKRPALIAALLYAIYPRIAWETADPYVDIWAVDFTIWLVAIYLALMRTQHRWRWLVAGGLCAGVGAYFRPQVLLLIPALAIVTLRPVGWRETARRITATTLIASLVLLPWVIRNYDDYHAFIPTRSGLWQTVLAGLDELPNHFGGRFKFEEITAMVHEARPDLREETPAWDAYLKGYAVAAIEQHPLFYAEILLHRVGLATVLPDEPALNDDGIIFRATGGVGHRIFVILDEGAQPALFVLALLCLGITWRRSRRANAMLVAVVACVLLPYIAIHVEARYLLPAAFVYFIWIGQGLDLLVDRVGERSHGFIARLAGGRLRTPSA